MGLTARVCLSRGRWLCEHGHSGGHGDSGRKCPHDVSLVHDTGGRGWMLLWAPSMFPHGGSGAAFRQRTAGKKDLETESWLLFPDA